MEIAQHPKSCVVVKLGGEVVAHEPTLMVALEQVAALVADGWRCVICHGGGPQTTALGQQLGLEATRVAGQRVTDEATLKVACQAIAGEVGCAVVAAAWAAGLRAVGLSSGVVQARRRPPVEIASEGGRRVDYGLVGDVTNIETDVFEACWAAELTPVLAPLGVDGAGGLLNINADTVAGAVAAALAAEHLFALTSVPGVLADRDDPGTRIPILTADRARAAIAAGTIAGGMIPKVEEALAALAGARAVHILAPEPGALVEAVARPGSRGTVLVRP